MEDFVDIVNQFNSHFSAGQGNKPTHKKCRFTNTAAVIYMISHQDYDDLPEYQLHRAVVATGECAWVTHQMDDCSV
jgi:hypothetical protein